MVRGSRRRWLTWRSLAVPGCVWLGAVGNASGQALNASALSFVPSLTVSETLTDNYRPGTISKEPDAITQVIGGIRMLSRSRKLNGSLDASLAELLYARHGQSNNHQKSLNAHVNSEWFEDHGFLDVSATVSRQNISAFGTLTGDATLVNANTTEVRSYQFAPSWRGRLLSELRYDVRLSQGATRSSQTGSSSSSNSGASMQVAYQGHGRLGGSVLLDHSALNYSTSRPTHTDRLVLTGDAGLPEADLKLALRGGHEQSNLTTLQAKSSTVWGLSLDWTPTNRTKLNASLDDQGYGRTHQLAFEHRLSRSILRMVSSRQLSNGAQSNVSRIGTAFDLLFAQFASTEPDPARRAVLVNAFLVQNGINPTGALPSSFQTSAASLVSRTELSVAYEGARDTLVASLFSSDTSRIDRIASVADDLSSGQHVKQTGYTLNLGHRLSPDATLNLISSVSSSKGTVAGQSSRYGQLSLQWSQRTSRNGTVSATLRHGETQSAAVRSAENAATASLNVVF